MPVSNPGKLFERVQKLTSVLSEHRKDLRMHRNVDEFFYMQKIEELKQLEESIEDAYKRLKALKGKFNSEYKLLYCSWKKDARWVNKFVNSQFEIKKSA